MFLKQIAALAKFTPEKMGKSTLAQGEFIFAGLNTFEPGQEHAPHKHEGQDKLYVVLQGTGDVRIGDAE
jgi:quercetin dioxygenase-like cupin family protein